MRLRPYRGFTLIELLVVIAIIGLLSSVVLASLNSARTKATDAKKKSELTEISNAVERYYLDTNAIPSNPTANWSTADSALGALVPNYLPAVPKSPDAAPYYYYNSGTYFIIASEIHDQYGQGSRGWHCSDATGGVAGSKFWCLETNI
jgi:general secretion pathway protein G